jgi:hypothetical protein
MSDKTKKSFSPIINNYFLSLATTLSSGSDITEYSVISQVVPAGIYLIIGCANCYVTTSNPSVAISIRTGSATFSSASILTRHVSDQFNASQVNVSSSVGIITLTAGETIHLGIGVFAGSGTR